MNTFTEFFRRGYGRRRFRTQLVLIFVLFVARAYAHTSGYKMFLFSQQSSVSSNFHVFSSHKLLAVVTPISKHAHIHFKFHDFFHKFHDFATKFHTVVTPVSNTPIFSSFSISIRTFSVFRFDCFFKIIFHNFLHPSCR